MASGRKQVKQKPTEDFMMTRPGRSAPTPDLPSLSLASGSSGYENAEDLMRSHDYEDLEPQISAFSCKNNNAIKYPQSAPISLPLEEKIEKQRQFSDDSSSGLIHIRNSWINKVILGLILAVSLTALVLVILVVVGVIGPKCGCNGKLVNTKHLEEANQPNFSTSSLFERIKRLEKNISSLMARDVIMMSMVGKHQKEILQLKTKLASFGEIKKKDPSASNFQENITTEVRALREKQVQLDTSLSVLQENYKTKTTNIQEMNTKVIGLAVAVKFLSTNDSLIKSKVQSLSQTEVRFRSSLESLKRKDADLDTSLQRAKNVEAYLNSSMNQLQFVDEKLKTKVDQMNSTFLTKINNITGMIHAMNQLGGLPAPPPGAGNLSQCKNVQNKMEGVSGSSAVYSVVFKEPKDKIVVGATCSTIRGDETNLSSGTNSRGEKVYICECKGEANVYNDSGNMKCFIDVWVCPRIS